MQQPENDRLAELEKRRAEALQKIDPSLTWDEAVQLAKELPVNRQAG